MNVTYFSIFFGRGKGIMSTLFYADEDYQQGS